MAHKIDLNGVRGIIRERGERVRSIQLKGHAGAQLDTLQIECVKD